MRGPSIVAQAPSADTATPSYPSRRVPSSDPRDSGRDPCRVQSRPRSGTRDDGRCRLPPSPSRMTSATARPRASTKPLATCARHTTASYGAGQTSVSVQGFPNLGFDAIGLRSRVRRMDTVERPYKGGAGEAEGARALDVLPSQSQRSMTGTSLRERWGGELERKG